MSSMLEKGALVPSCLEAGEKKMRKENKRIGVPHMVPALPREADAHPHPLTLAAVAASVGERVAPGRCGGLLPGWTGQAMLPPCGTMGKLAGRQGTLAGRQGTLASSYKWVDRSHSEGRGVHGRKARLVQLLFGTC